MGMLTNAIALTKVVDALETEKHDIIDWMVNDVVQPSSAYHNVIGYITSGTLLTANLATLRALRDRILIGDDEISLNTVSAIMGDGKEGRTDEVVTITIRVAPLRAVASSVCVKWAIRGMDRYGYLDGHLSGEEWKENSAVLVEAVLALINAGGSNDLLSDSNDDSSYVVSALSLPSDELATLFIKHRDRFDDIVDIMRDRWTTDHVLIATILGSAAKPLSHGEL